MSAAEVKRYAASYSEYHEHYKICTRESAEMVLASDYDAVVSDLTERNQAQFAAIQLLSTERDSLRSQNEALVEALDNLLRLEAVKDDDDLDLLIAREKARAALELAKEKSDVRRGES